MKKNFGKIILILAVLATPVFVQAQTCTAVESGRFTCVPTAAPLPESCTNQGTAMQCGSVPPGYLYILQVFGSITITPAAIDQGGSATLSWTVQNGAECTISGTSVKTIDSITVSPQRGGFFSLLCKATDQAGRPAGSPQTIDSVQLTVRPPPNPEVDNNPTTYTPSGQAVDTNLTYIPLEPLPALGGAQSGQGNFGELVAGVFRILINVGAFAAVLFLVLGGIAYMVSENTFKKMMAKERIRAALWGLGILAASWLILNTINPQLVTFRKDLLAPAQNSVVFIEDPTPEGLEKKQLTDEQYEKLKQELNLQCNSVGSCLKTLAREVLVLDPRTVNTSGVQDALKRYIAYCDIQTTLRYKYDTKPGSTIGMPGKSVTFCVHDKL